MNNTQVARTFTLVFSGKKQVSMTFTNIEPLENSIRQYAEKYSSFVWIFDAFSNKRYGHCDSSGTIVWFYKHLFTNDPSMCSSYKSPPPKKVTSLSNIAVSPDEVGMVTLKPGSSSYIADYSLEQQRKDIQEFTQRVKEQNQRLAEASVFAERFSAQLKSTPTPTKEQSMKFEQRYYLNGNNIEDYDLKSIQSVLSSEEKAIEELKAFKFQTKQLKAEIKQREEQLAEVVKFLDDRYDAEQAKQ